MDIWHTGYQGDKPKTAGWLGRYLDATADVDGHEVPALHFGAEQQPLALTGRRVHVPSVRSLEQFRLQSDADDFPAVLGPLVATARPSESPLLGFVQTSSAAALAASQRVSARVHAYDAKANYAESPLAQKLRMVARLIDAELGTRIFYVELDGFDTHSRQADAHAGLLRQLGDAASAFITDVSAHGHGERVLLIAFSEFGRRVQENASAGTDHGAAAPMFVAGARIAPGLIGGHPSLQDLDDGDLKHHTDFRRVYATVLEDWLHWSSEPVLGKRFERLPLILT
jgi:uncharacterized protein (DUF1501 family)